MFLACKITTNTLLWMFYIFSQNLRVVRIFAASNSPQMHKNPQYSDTSLFIIIYNYHDYDTSLFIIIVIIIIHNHLNSSNSEMNVITVPRVSSGSMHVQVKYTQR